MVTTTSSSSRVPLSTLMYKTWLRGHKLAPGGKKRKRGATNFADVISNSAKLAKRKHANHDATKPWKECEVGKASLKHGKKSFS